MTPEQALRDVFGLPAFRPGQADVVEAQVAGRDVLSVAPTGSGKSVSYWIPALLGPGVTLVVSPLIALMKDQVDRLRSLGVEAAFVNSSIDRAEQWARLQDALNGRLKLLYVAPERLSRPDFVDVLGRLPVRRVVVDEAHCISTWGHDFRPDYRLIGRALEICGNPPAAAFTATATPQVRADIVRTLGLRDPLVSVTGFNRPNLLLAAARCRGDADKVEALKKVLDPGAGRALVYCATVATTEEVADRIRGWGFAAAAYHARLGDEARRRVQEDFAAGRLQVVVATVAFGMGVDIPDIRQVVHYHLPGSLEAYYQEAGRAGRDGEPALCLLLWRPGDRELQQFLIDKTFEEGGGGADSDARREHALAKLQTALAYARGSGCRHARIADYFGQEGTPRTCAACDNCRDGGRAGGHEEAVAGAHLRAALEAVRRFSGRIGAANVAAVLAGADTKWVREKSWVRELPFFGALAGWTQERVRDLLSELLTVGLAAQSSGDYPTLVLTRSGAAVLEGEQLVELTLPAAPAPAAPKARPAATALTTPDRQLFDRLRQWRAEKARALDVPAFVVFSDRTLAELSTRRPASRAALLAVPGIGQAKLSQYGDEVLKLLSAL
jgi:ATP-dependent DNA helicase RecQ